MKAKRENQKVILIIVGVIGIAMIFGFIYSHYKTKTDIASWNERFEIEQKIRDMTSQIYIYAHSLDQKGGYWNEWKDEIWDDNFYGDKGGYKYTNVLETATTLSNEYDVAYQNFELDVNNFITFIKDNPERIAQYEKEQMSLDVNYKLYDPHLTDLDGLSSNLLKAENTYKKNMEIIKKGVEQIEQDKRIVERTISQDSIGYPDYMRKIFDDTY